MKSIFKLITLPLLLVTTTVQADVQLTLDEGISLHVVNEEAWNGPGVFDSRSPVILENGVNQIVVNMTAELGRNREDSIIERSDSFVIRFQAEDTSLTLNSSAIRSRADLEAFNKTPTWVLQDAEGNKVEFHLGTLEISGFQLVRDYEKEIARFNKNSDSEAALKARNHSGMPSYSFSPRSMPSGDMTEDQEVVRQMLRYWYLKADDNTKSEMKRWIQSGE